MSDMQESDPDVQYEPAGGCGFFFLKALFYTVIGMYGCIGLAALFVAIGVIALMVYGLFGAF